MTRLVQDFIIAGGLKWDADSSCHNCRPCNSSTSYSSRSTPGQLHFSHLGTVDGYDRFGSSDTGSSSRFLYVDPAHYCSSSLAWPFRAYVHPGTSPFCFAAGVLCADCFSYQALLAPANVPSSAGPNYRAGPSALPIAGRIATQAKIEKDRRLKRIEEAMKLMHGLRHYGGLSYEDLCLFSHVSRPEKFKVPEFEQYDGAGNPMMHLRLYLAKWVHTMRI
ncbi:hypothetical protein CRG98_007684 [Punica granatum]|uniref:Uncharacterized protein n=1 Tax=Punica granatum TaxID=22663 RepID=A0A2I0KVN7_PUNGR|nr:hypothetical protein CRG98_007684 [Punica granatum]